MSASTVVYDADCGICGWSANWIARNAPTLEVVGHIDYGVEELGSVWLVDESEMHEGADAVARILEAAEPRWCHLVGRLMRLPVVILVARGMYRLVARNRRLLSRAFGLRACAVTPVRRNGD